jgi:hypothetical protein
MRYVNHYEIEVKINNEWTFLACNYPRYEWKFYRPWYLLWLAKRPYIVDALNPALVCRINSITAAGEFAYTVSPHTPARIWQVVRHGKRLRKSLNWETP